MIRSIRAQENVIGFEYKTGNADEIVWIVGPVTQADTATMTNSPHTQPMILVMTSGRTASSSWPLKSSSPGRPPG